MESIKPLAAVDANVPRRSQRMLKLENRPSSPSSSHEPGQMEGATDGSPQIGCISPDPMRRPSLNGQPSFQRPRKRLTWRNKACIIALPLEDEHGRRTSRVDYLKPKEVLQRLRAWEERGFNTSGFLLADPSVGDACGSQGQSRSLHPNPEEEDQERRQASFRVLIPNKQEFEAHLAELREEKLRSLGVTMGDEDLQSGRSPVPSLMSRQASSQSSALLTSPNLQAQFVPSNSYGGSNQSVTGIGSKTDVAHFPRYSVASPFGDKSTNQSQNAFVQSSGHRIASPMGYMSSQASSRIASPSLNEHLSSVSTFPLRTGSSRTSSPKPGALLPSSESEKPSSNPDRVRESGSFPPQTLLLNSQGARLDMKSAQPSAKDEPSLITPTPRSHRQNPSESLQREVEEAEAYLDSLDNRAKESPNQLSQDNTTQGPTEIGLADMSDVRDKKTKVEGDLSVTAAVDRSKHGSKSSISSKLNVNAPEFRFEPISVPQSDVFAFLPDSQQNKTSQPSVQSASLGQHARKASLARPLPKLNAAAPAWTPDTSMAKPNSSSHVFSFGNEVNRKSTTGFLSEGNSRQFSFSAQPPSLNPDAPTFTPNLHSGDETAPGSTIEPQQNKIFGNVSLTNALKPAKESKALPIVTPGDIDDDLSPSEGPEDESGRITQSDARQKRPRRDDFDGDRVPQFAASPQDVRPFGSSKQYGPISDILSDDSVKDAPTLAATNMLEELVGDMTASESSSIQARGNASRSRSRSYERQSFSSHNQHSSPITESDRRPGSAGYDVMNSAHLPNSHSPTLSSDLGKGQTSDKSSNTSSHSSNSARAATNVAGLNRELARTDISPPRDDVLRGMRYVDPAYHEIDFVMKHLKQDGNSDLGIERSPSPLRPTSAEGQRGRPPREVMQETVKRQLLPHVQIRSDAPSPSPNRLYEPFQYLRPSESESKDSIAARFVEDNAPYSPSYRPSKTSPQVHRLNSPGSSAPSDWNDAFSSVDETWLKSKAKSNHGRLQDDIGAIVQRQLHPFEKSLARIQDSLGLISKRWLGGTTGRRPFDASPHEVDLSDADDEDETQSLSGARRRSPPRDRKYEQLKSLVNEIGLIQQKAASPDQLADITNTLGEIKASMSQNAHTTQNNVDINKVVDDAVNRQMRGKSAPVISSSQAAAAEKSQLQITGLESMLKVAEDRAEDEMKARRATEDALADNQRLLRQALQEAAQQRESVEAIEAKIQEFNEERHHNLRHTAILEGSQESLEKAAADLEEKNQALENTLAEYRLSHEQWRTDMNNVRHEKKELQRQKQNVELELHKAKDEKDALKALITELQDQLAQASIRASEDLLQGRKSTDEHKNRLDLLSARLEAEARTRERLEVEIERLEAQEKDSMRARFQVEQTQNANAHLDQLVGNLRVQLHESQNQCAQLQKEVAVTREMTKLETHKIRSTAEADLRSAKHEGRTVQQELQDTISRLKRKLENEALDAAEAKSQSVGRFNEVLESRKAALQEASEMRLAALEEQASHHKVTLEHLEVQHQRSLEDILEKEQRSQADFVERLQFADQTSADLQAKIVHLEESLEISKAAAHAAVQAVQSSKTTISSHPATVASDPKADMREKISPQALRESIMVLQEQLQARESTIEELELKIANVDPKAPEQLKEAAEENAWLRELLAVRIDDLQDIIDTVSGPSFHQDTVRDAAIRLKANIQMEQQEKERLHGRSAGLPFASIANLAASPKAFPMAAAAAWSNWRKRHDIGVEHIAGREYNSPNQTPSKQSSSPHSSLSGLLTPPDTNVKATSPYRATGSGSGLASAPKRPRTPTPHKRGSDSASIQLLRKASYDLDAAEATVFGNDYDVDGEDNDNPTRKSEVHDEEEPFGPRIGTFSGQPGDSD